MIIAVDFDGTIATSDGNEPYSIGEPMPDALDTLRRLKRDGHTLVLWTCRGDIYLEEALEWLEGHGVRKLFKAVNENIHPLGKDGYMPRKIFAHFYVDDRVVGGFPGWDEVYRRISTRPRPIIDSEGFDYA